MYSRIRFLAILGVAAAVACSDDPTPTGADRLAAPAAEAPSSPGTGHASPRADQARNELLARRMALALRDPEFRAYVKATLDRSPFPERKLYFQRFLGASGKRALRAIARANGRTEAGIEADAKSAMRLELYMPVPEHRAAWTGDEHVLVATATDDGEAPVAFDLRGRRQVLSATTPPTTPVLALVPVETNFDRPARANATCTPETCGGGGGGGWDPPPPPPPTYTPGLYMTASRMREDFEGWLKGAPEFEAHIMGQKGTTDSLTSYQCAGERAPGSYRFNQDQLSWTGNVLLFSQTQINNYKAQHPTHATRLVFLEDDDEPCEPKFDNPTFAEVVRDVDGLTRGLSGGRDTTKSAAERVWKYAKTALSFLAEFASFFQTNDEVIGNAVQDVTIGEFYPGYNWVIKAQDNRTNGYVRLIMR